MVKLQDRYSAETWPNEPLPALRLRTWPAATISADGWIHAQPNRQAIESLIPQVIEGPPELHLREFGDVDLHDEASLLEFVRTCGFPLEPNQPWAGVTNARLLEHLRPGYYKLMIKNFARQLDYGVPPLDDRPTGESAHLSEVALRVFYVQQLVRHLEAVLLGESVSSVWQEIGGFDFASSELSNDPLLEDAPADTIAWYFFSELLNEGLSTISPRITPQGYGRSETSDIANAYTAGCVLVFNDLVERMPYRRCADETCNRLFKNQVGRSGGMYSRSDARFCSPLHARNQSQRERRRRDRADRKEQDNE